jgi:phosphopantothenoylcysteine decarboxylase/phosphopantothenate--cysteine ligase
MQVSIARTYDAYRDMVLERVQSGLFAGVFSAGVADYRPKQVVDGKIVSGSAEYPLILEPTEKVIDLAMAAAPAMHTIAFKYLEKVSEEELIRVAAKRLDRARLVVATRGEDTRGREQRALMVTRDTVVAVDGKAQIAAAIADHLEALVPAQDVRLAAE